MAPDKIYMTPSYEEPDNVLLASFSKSHLYGHRDIEYIRKDALIKWFNNNIKSLNVLFGEIFIARVKDKLNSM